MYSLTTLKFYATIPIALTAFCAAMIPLFKNKKSEILSFRNAEAFAIGVFLGVSLAHLLPDASSQFHDLGFHFPIAFVIAGVTFLALQSIDIFAKQLYQQSAQAMPASLVVVTLVMLSIHSFFAGVSLGLSRNMTLFVAMLFGILSHKWAESFALAIQLKKYAFTVQVRYLLLAGFILMTPLGLILFSFSETALEKYSVMEPCVNAFSAGILLYLSVSREQCSFIFRLKTSCKEFLFLILGFLLMVLAGFWV